MNEVSWLIIADGIYIFSSLLLFILIIVNYSSLHNSNYSYMYSLGLNWKNGPISIINPNNACKSQESYLITDKWQGSNPGCYCPDYFNLFNCPLRSGYCSGKKDRYCNDVNSISPIQYKVWRGIALCGERISNNYLELNFAPTEKSCPQNTRSCGILDSLNNVLCIADHIECPYNFMKVIAKTERMPTDMNYTKIEGNDVNFIFSKENKDGKIIVEYKISDGQPCADPYYKNFKSKPYLLDPYYKYAHCDQSIGNKYKYDERYWFMDKQDKNYMMQENGISEYINELPEYPYYENETTNLYLRNYIGINTFCIDDIKSEINPKELIDILLKINDNISSSITIALITLIFGIVLFLCTICYFVVLQRNLYYRQDEKLIFLILPIIISFVTFILFGIIRSNLNVYSTKADFFSKQECVDSITYEAAKNFNENIATARSVSHKCVILSTVLLIIPLLEFLNIKLNFFNINN